MLATPNEVAGGAAVSLGALGRRGMMMRRTLVTTLGILVAVLVLALLAVPASAADEFEKYELESVSASLSSSQAGVHADFTISFAESRRRLIESGDFQ